MSKKTNSPKATSLLRPAIYRILILGILLGIIFLVVSFFLAHRYMESTKNQRLSNLSQMVHMARNAIQPIIKDFHEKKINKQTAVNRIRDMVRRMTYHDHSGKNYIFMSSYDGTMLVQPFEPEKEMTNMWDLLDHHGKFIIQELIKAAKSPQGKGFVQYHYLAPASGRPQEKYSFVIGIPELDCYIGTGKYMDDIRAAQRNYIWSAVGLTTLLLILLMILVKYSIKEVKKNLEKLSHENQEHKKTHQALKQSEARFRLAFDNAAIGRAIAQVDGQFIRVNKYFAQIMGMKVSELRLKSWQEIIHPDHLTEKDACDQALLENKETGVQMKARLLSLENLKIWARISYVLIRDKEDHPMYFVCDIQDISAQIAYEDMLKKYERIVDTSIDQMSLVNRDYVYEAVNEAYVKNHDLKREDIVGHSVAEINSQIAFEKTIKSHLDAALEGRIIQYQSEFKYRGLGQRYMDVWYFPYKNAKNEVSAVVVHVKDITETKIMEDKLLQAQKMEAIGTLAGGIAHDFNNILSAIMGHAELAQMSLEGETKISANLSQIVVAAERAKELVKQILTFSRKSETDLRLIDLNQQLLESINLLKRTIPKMVEIEIKLGQELEPVMADATQLNQVIMNLASNASDAMPEGGKLTFATTSMDLDQDFCETHLEIKPGRYLILTVTDTGSGIDKKTQDKIFDPFFTTKEIGKGTGLGLSTVYGIIKEHGGQITCYSELGQGTSFRVYLPVHETAMRLNLPVLTIQEVAGGDESILLVDDEAAIRKSSALILENKGYTVQTAANGEEALNVFQGHPSRFDLVILDLGMPGMGGKKCLKQLLALDPSLKILIASGYSADGRIQDTLNQGASAFIAKPFRGNELLKAVRRLLDR